MLELASELLHKYFGYSSFRKGQEEAISSILAGNDTVCIMPTGGGKSLCYQIPALAMEGTTLVISPLISLMKDQVDALLQSGIPATFINSSLSAAEENQRLEEIRQGKYKLIYVAPERLNAWGFIELIQQLKVPFIAIDEAHCISQWGHDFRPSYLQIQQMINKLSYKPIIAALTATATPHVRQDICRILTIPKENIILTGFERENLSFHVIKGQDRKAYLRHYLEKNQQDGGIIYAATRKVVDQLYAQLQSEGLRVGRYHAGMSDVERKEEQEKFLRDETTVMVATSAFGMGIDKSNIRYCIHYQLPKNMESYYQEAGRAGRDGLASDCILLYSSQDVQVQRFLIDQSTDTERVAKELEKLQSMVDYCHTEGCLQEFILHYFGEKGASDCGRCGNCTDSRQTVDVTKEAQMVLSCIVRMGQRFGKGMVAKVLTGSKDKKVRELNFEKLPTYGILKEKSTKEVSEFIEFLISQNLVGVEHGTYPTIFMTPEGKEVILGNVSVSRKEMTTVRVISNQDPLFEELRSIRKELADNEGVPPFLIFSDATLKDMCGKLPHSMEELLAVNGVGEMKLQKYGEAFLKGIVQFCEEHPEVMVDKPALIAPVRKKKSEGKSHLHTYELYKEGHNLETIAEKREMAVSTIEAHLLQCAEQDLPISVADFIPEHLLRLLENAVSEVGPERLKPIKEMLPDEVSYFMIRLYLRSLQK